MDITIRPMNPQERLYCYSQSSQISGQTSCVGYLRTDMGSDGKEFRSSWFDVDRGRKTEDFLTELDDVVNALRFDGSLGGILKDRKTMSNYCRGHMEAGLGDDKSFGFRIDTEKYAYMLRLTPRAGEYDLYCYCYERRWLDRHMGQAEKGIRFIDSSYKELFRIPDGDKIRITGEDGYRVDFVCRYIDDAHVEVGSGYDNLFHICQFAEQMEQCHNTVIPLRSSLPERSYVYLPDTREIGIVKKGEMGCFSSDLTPVYGQEGEAFVDELNRSDGITKAQAEAMLAGSRFGWDCPAADPKNYDENGKLIAARNRDRSMER